MPKIYRTGQRIDHYQIIRPLGRGGTGQVYLAQDWHAQREVVLKFHDDDVIGGAAAFERYQREVEIGKRLIHPRIRRHLNQGEQRSAEYMVLEYLRGQTLRALMMEHTPTLLSTHEVLRMMFQVCEALIYTHENGVIHCDIKPENIMLLENGDIKIFDFGIAHVGKERRIIWRGLSSPIGTPDYMPPERFLNRSVDERADVYAVGIVLYELLCGRTPFQEQDGFAIITQHISHDPPDVLQFNPTLSPVLATVIMRAIRRDPDKRYPGMQNLLNDLQCLDTVKPVDYVPDPPKPGGRYRQAAPIVCLLLVVCLLIISFGFFAQGIHSSVH